MSLKITNIAQTLYTNCYCERRNSALWVSFVQSTEQSALSTKRHPGELILSILAVCICLSCKMVYRWKLASSRYKLEAALYMVLRWSEWGRQGKGKWEKAGGDEIKRMNKVQEKTFRETGAWCHLLLIFFFQVILTCCECQWGSKPVLSDFILNWD